MRRASAILLSLALAGPVAAAAPLNLDQWAGVYKTRHVSGDVSGETYQVENILEIVKLGESTAYVRSELRFYNGHTCSLTGVAEAQGNDLVLRRKPEFGDDKACMLKLVHYKDKLVLRDAHSCNGYCGMRGAFEGTVFPTGARRPIRYMTRLKASAEFTEALTAYAKR